MIKSGAKARLCGQFSDAGLWQCDTSQPPALTTIQRQHTKIIDADNNHSRLADLFSSDRGDAGKGWLQQQGRTFGA
jgi:hypothetical protein